MGQGDGFKWGRIESKVSSAARQPAACSPIPGSLRPLVPPPLTVRALPQDLVDDERFVIDLAVELCHRGVQLRERRVRLLRRRRGRGAVAGGGGGVVRLDVGGALGCGWVGVNVCWKAGARPRSHCCVWTLEQTTAHARRLDVQHTRGRPLTVFEGGLELEDARRASCPTAPSSIASTSNPADPLPPPAPGSSTFSSPRSPGPLPLDCELPIRPPSGPPLGPAYSESGPLPGTSPIRQRRSRAGPASASSAATTKKTAPTAMTATAHPGSAPPRPAAAASGYGGTVPVNAGLPGGGEVGVGCGEGVCSGGIESERLAQQRYHPSAPLT